jgi:hypothetical protein
MDKPLKSSNSECYAPLSESFTVYYKYYVTMSHASEHLVIQLPST